MFRNFGSTKEMKQKGHGYVLHNWPDSGPPKPPAVPAGFLSPAQSRPAVAVPGLVTILHEDFGFPLVAL